MAVTVDVPKRTIHVTGSMSVDFQGKDSLHLILWEKSIIHSFSLDGVPLSYTFDSTSTSPIMYIPNGRRLLVVSPVRYSRIQVVAFDYESNMKDLQGWAKSFSDDWIELNF